MWSIFATDTRDQISKTTVSNYVKRLSERHVLVVTRDNQGRVALVNVVQYDGLREQFGDASKAQAPAGKMMGRRGRRAAADRADRPLENLA